MVACFYLPQFGIAVERARLNHLWGEPVGLATAEDTLAAISDEAFLAGIHVGQSVSGARSLCERLLVLPYDRAAYEEAAQPLWDLFAIESSLVEPVSAEVCFVELEGAEALQIGTRLAESLTSAMKVPVRAGLARTKFVARQAALSAGTSKPSSSSGSMEVLTVPGGKEPAFLASLPIEAAGVDYKTLQRLQRLGIKTLGDVRRIPARVLQRSFKELALTLGRLALGEDFDRVKPLWPPRSIEREIEFESEAEDSALLEQALKICADDLAQKLGGRHEYGRTLHLSITLADESMLEASEKPAIPLQTTSAIQNAAARLLQRIQIHQPVTKVRLRAGDLGTGSGVQLSLLDSNRQPQAVGKDSMGGLPHEQARRLEATLAYLRKRFGTGAVVSAGRLRNARRIRLWTYPLGRRINEPIQVTTDARGRPIGYWRGGRSREVMRIQDMWKEAEWFWGALHEETVYRVETEPAGLSELHVHGRQWRLRELSD